MFIKYELAKLKKRAIIMQILMTLNKKEGVMSKQFTNTVM
jgi:hypothetical protein